MAERIPAHFLRDAVLLGNDVRRGRRVSDDEFAFLQGEMHGQWRGMWDELDGPVATRQNFTEMLMPVMMADQTAVPGTAEGVLWGAQFSALPGNFYDAPGKTIRVRAVGVMTTGATPGTLTFTPRYGTTTGGTSLGAGTVSGTLVANKTNVPWFLDYTLVCRAIGSAGSVAGFGIWESPQGYTTAPGCVEVGGAVVTTIDTNSASGGMTVGSTASNAGTSLTCRKLAIEALN